MDANDLEGLRRFNEARTKGATGAATNPQEAEAIQQARQQLAHEKETYWSYDQEFREILDVRDLDELEQLQPVLVRQVFPRCSDTSDIRTNPPRPIAKVERRGYRGLEQWLQDIDAIAQRLGYVKPTTMERVRGAISPRAGARPPWPC